MKTAILASVALLAGATHGSSIPREAEGSCKNITCTTGKAAHILVSRASTEAAGTGIIGAVADAVVAKCPGSDIVAVPYPALLSPYVDSEQQGVGNLTTLALQYSTCCPNSKIVLMGYSQGAQVTADFLCGTSEVGFPVTDPYSTLVSKSLAAAVLMGDPSYVKGLSWDKSNATNVSYFPRVDNVACLPVKDKIVSYCDSGDYFCDNGTSANALAIHEGYVAEYGAAAASFVAGKLRC